MKTLLTIAIEEDILKTAERFAAAQNSDVSTLVREYLYRLTTDFVPSPDKTPVLASLTGILTTTQTAEDLEQEYYRSREAKYQ